MFDARTPPILGDNSDDGGITTSDALATTIAESPQTATDEGTPSPKPAAVAGGFVSVLPVPTGVTLPKKITSLGDDYSNWGNEGLW